MKVTTNKNISVIIFVKSMYILESKTKIAHRLFFMNRSGEQRN